MKITESLEKLAADLDFIEALRPAFLNGALSPTHFKLILSSLSNCKLELNKIINNYFPKSGEVIKLEKNKIWEQLYGNEDRTT